MEGTALVKQQIRDAAKFIVYGLLTLLFGDSRGFVKLTVLRGPAKGLRMYLDIATRRESPYWLGKYDPEILASCARLIEPGMTVWDCGIYIGYYTCFFARLVGPSGQVVAFEPDPACVERSRENVALNGFGNVLFVDAAVGPSTGRTQFIFSGNTNGHLPGGWIGSTREEYAATVEKIVAISDVDVLTLDAAMNRPGVRLPDLLKIDIEGIEGAALPAARELIAKCRPIFVVELHNPDCDRAVWEFFTAVGYSVVRAGTLEPVLRWQDSRGTLLCRPTAGPFNG